MVAVVLPSGATIELPSIFLVAPMGTIVSRKRDKGATYTAQIRLKAHGRVVFSEARTFDRRALAAEWLRRREAELDAQRARGEPLVRRDARTLRDLIQWYCANPVTPFGRTKSAALDALGNTALAAKPATALGTQDYMAHAAERRKSGAAPATTLNDLVWLRQVLRAARSALGVQIDLQAFEDAIHELRRTRVIAKARKRRRRLSPDEEATLLSYFERRDARSQIPMRDIVLFALASARRQEEITRLRWDDLRPETGTAWLDDVKHPTHKTGNRREFRMLASAWEIVNRQPRISTHIFPFNSKTIGTAFTRACRVLALADLRFHDLRHEAISRLFERGYDIYEVSQISLHESWATLKIYTQAKPEHVKEK